MFSKSKSDYNKIEIYKIGQLKKLLVILVNIVSTRMDLLKEMNHGDTSIQ